MSYRKKLIEVERGVASADTITVTKDEILTALNKLADRILVIVEFLGNDQRRVHSIRRPCRCEPDFGVTSVNYDLAELPGRVEMA